MITSPHNEKLKLVRKLRERKHREREGALRHRGRGPARGGPRRRRGAALPAHRRRQRPGRRGGRAGAAGGGLHARLGDARDRRLGAALGRRPRGALRLPARGRRPRQRRRDRAHRRTPCSAAPSRSAPDCADPVRPKAVRASMGSIFGRPPAAGRVEETPAPRVGAGRPRRRGARGAGGAATLCLGAEREGLPDEVLESASGGDDPRCAPAPPSRSTSPPRRRSPASGYRRAPMREVAPDA